MRFLGLVAVQFPDQFDFQFAQFPVGDDQKVAAPAGRIEKFHFTQPLVKGFQCRAAAMIFAPFEPLKLRSQIVEEQRFDHFQDVFLGGVMGTLGASLGGFHHGLKECAENGGRDCRPVEPTGVEQHRTHLRVEIRNRQPYREQVAVDIGEAGKVFIELGLAPVHGRIQHLKQSCEPAAEVGAIFPGPGLQQIQEDVAWFEDAGVIGEQAEHRTHQKHFQIMAVVPGCLECVVQPSHQLRGFNINRVLIAEGPALHAQDEAELLDVGRQVCQRESGLLALVKVVKLEVLKIADQDVARPVFLG